MIRAPLKRNVFVRDRPRSSRLRLGHTLIEVVASAGRRAAGAASGFSAAAALATSSQQNQVAADNLGHISFLAGGFVVPRARLQASLDVHLSTLLQILARDFRQTLPQHDIVPLGAVLPLAAFVFES